MGVVYAVFNQGGGVGKTLVAQNIAEAFAEPPESNPEDQQTNMTILIDADPQGHATEATGLRDEWAKKDTTTIYHGLKDPDDSDARGMLRKTEFDRTLVIPSNYLMMKVESELVPASNNETRLLDLNRRIRKAVSTIIVDSPSYFGKLTNNILKSIGIPIDIDTGDYVLPRNRDGSLTADAADILRSGLIVPVAAEPKSVRALEILLEHIKTAQREMRIHVNVVAIVLSNIGQDTTISNGIIKDYRAMLKDRMFLGQIDHFVGYLECFEQGKSIFSYVPLNAKGKKDHEKWGKVKRQQQVFRDLRDFVKQRSEENYQAYLKKEQS